MGGLASLYWETDGTEKAAEQRAPGFKSDSKAYADWIAGMLNRVDERAALNALSLGALVDAHCGEEEPDASAWTAPVELAKAARVARQLLVEKDPRFEPILRVYAERGYPSLGRAKSHKRAWSSRAWRADIRREAQENPFLLANTLSPSEERDAVELYVAAENGAFLAQLDAASFLSLSAKDDDDEMVQTYEQWLGDAKKLSNDELYYRAEQKLEEAASYCEDAEDHQSDLLRVGKALMGGQHAFLENGPESRVLVSLEGLSQEVGMAQKVVRLILENNSIRTPHGVFPLEHFIRDLAATPEPKISAKEKKIIESNRTSMAQDFLDVAAMAEWAVENRIRKVAMRVTW